MLTEKTLKKWRTEALRDTESTRAQGTRSLYADTAPNLVETYLKNQERILKLTQELLDQHLMKKGES